jgi:hypothetical protein
VSVQKFSSSFQRIPAAVWFTRSASKMHPAWSEGSRACRPARLAPKKSKHALRHAGTFPLLIESRAGFSTFCFTARFFEKSPHTFYVRILCQLHQRGFPGLPEELF